MEADFQTASAPPRVTLTTSTIDVETTPNKVVVSIIGEVDMADADRVGEVLIDAASAGKPVVCVDLAGLEFADSSAIKAILLGAKAAEAHGVSFELLNPHGGVIRLLGITGLSDALTVIDAADAQAGPSSLSG